MLVVYKGVPGSDRLAPRRQLPLETSMTTREYLEVLNSSCAERCAETNYWTPARRPNMRLLYSTPETFEPPARILWLGKNPGGEPDDGDRHPHDVPFRQRRGWSSYLDDDWGRFRRGEHPMQRGVLAAASLFAGGADEGRALLRSSPAANLSPYRSRSWDYLPRDLRDISVGESLIRLAQPRVVVLFFSESSLWRRLMDTLDRAVPSTRIRISGFPGYTFRESVCGERPEYVFGLPGFNSQTSPHNETVLKTLRERIALHDLSDGRA